MKSFKTLEVFGVETEYGIVDEKSLDIKPIADKILIDPEGNIRNEIENGEVSWSNELALHVAELKLTQPQNSLNRISDLFHENIQEINKILKPAGAFLLPTAMHPFVTPDKIFLWPHGQKEIYEKYNSIFNCNGHGWINVQSTHLNISFNEEKEFASLHNIIRFLLPLFPGLCASSPIYEGKFHGYKDSRLKFYSNNQHKIPQISGNVIPEKIHSFEEYKNKILNPMYEAILPFDPEKILQYEWLNSRGAIARFDRNAVEIRVLDTQEASICEEAVLKAIKEIISYFFNHPGKNMDHMREFSQKNLEDIFYDSIEYGEDAIINNDDYLSLFGLSGSKKIKEVWIHIFTEILQLNNDSEFFNIYKDHGTLSSRILAELNVANPGNLDRDRIIEVYKNLADCLEENRIFIPGKFK